MIEFSAFKPNILAPTIIVDQVLGFYRIGSLVQVTYGFTATSGGGATEIVQGCNLVWEPHKFLKAKDMVQWAITEWRDGTFKEVSPDALGMRRPRAQ